MGGLTEPASHYCAKRRVQAQRKIRVICVVHGQFFLLLETVTGLFVLFFCQVSGTRLIKFFYASDKIAGVFGGLKNTCQCPIMFLYS